MLIFDPARESRDPNFNTVLERLRVLVADMEAVRAGCAPAGLASEPPLLDRWRLGWRPAACLTGHSTGHPLLPGTERQILTSDLQLLSRDRQWARTNSRWYRLGAPRLAHAPAQAPLDHADMPPLHAKIGQRETMTDTSAEEQQRDKPEGTVSGPGASSPPSALRPLARLAVGRSGADIERIVREARRTARRAGRSLNWSDLVEVLGAARHNRPKPMRWRMAVHEAAHALVHLAVGSGALSIISIEADHGGIVQIESEAHAPETEARLMSQIIVRLAGRAGEEIVLGDPVAGSGGAPDSDLAVATDLAIMLETSLGFGHHQRLLYRDVGDRSHLLTLDARLAAAVHARLEACYGQARAILEAEGAAHLWLASTLLRSGVLEGDELAGVVGEVRQRMIPQDHDQLAGGGPSALPTEESSAVR